MRSCLVPIKNHSSTKIKRFSTYIHTINDHQIQVTLCTITGSKPSTSKLKWRKPKMRRSLSKFEMATESKEKKKKQQQNMRKRSTSHTHKHTLAKTTTTEWSENTVTAIAKKGGERAQTFRYYVVSFSHITVSLWDGRHYRDGAYEDCALFVHYSLWHAQASTSDGVIMIDCCFFRRLLLSMKFLWPIMRWKNQWGKWLRTRWYSMNSEQKITYTPNPKRI